MKPSLTIVSSAPVRRGGRTAKIEPLALAQPGMKAIPPERRLPAMFRRRDELARELALVDLDIAEQRRRYARNHGLLMLPSIDTLRRLFGGKR